MKHFPKTSVVLIFWGIALFTLMKNANAYDNMLSLHYNSPAKEWVEALPIGNGHLGGMIFGGLEDEDIQINVKSLWSGSPQESDRTDGWKSLHRIEELIEQGKYDQADNLAQQTMTCVGGGSWSGASATKPYGCYQTLGDIRLSFPESSEPYDYERFLDLSTAIAGVHYRIGDASYSREAFCSYPDHVLVYHLACNLPGHISLTVRMNRPEDYTTRTSGDNTLIMSGSLDNGHGGEGMKYEARLLVKSRGGKVIATDQSIQVSNANSVTLLLAANTDYLPEPPTFKGYPYLGVTKKQIDMAAQKTYAQLKKNHLKDYQSLFSRVSLDLGKTNAIYQSTDKRIRDFANSDDPALIALYFQFGRYLLISSSRPGDLPANLQGIWANQIQTPWNGDYHTDINIQMNYWPSETTNLSECSMPLFELLRMLVKPGQRTARDYFHCKGWTLNTITNPWGYTSPGESIGWGLFPMGGPWVCRQIWEHYAFSGDKNFLRRYYPILKGAARFCMEYLAKDPITGKLISGPGISPENVFSYDKGKTASLSMGASVNQEITWDIFTHFLKAAKALNDKGEFVHQIALARKNLLIPRIGPDGRLMEWLHDFGETDIHHRHLSHLYAVYPGDEFTLNLTPKMCMAAEKSLRVRGDGGTGWSMAWKISLWARFLNGDHAYRMLRNLISESTLPDMFDTCPPFQIDGNFGGTAGIAEMLIQSQNGVIDLLPALPHAWSSGKFSGLRARGGATVSVAWKHRIITQATIKATLSGTKLIQAPPGLTLSSIKCDGRNVAWKKTEDNQIKFKAVRGKTYLMKFRPEI